MKIKKAIVILLVLQATLGIYSEVSNFYYPYWIQDLSIPDAFDISQFLIRLIHLFSDVLVFIGVYKLIQLKKIDIIRIFKFPIYLYTISNIYWLITTVLSTKYSFFILPEETPSYFYIFKILNVLLLILIFVNFLRSKNLINKDINKNEVKKHSRFFNYILDHLIILAFGIKNIRFLSDGFVFDYVDFLNSDPTWFFLIYIFFYYFILEFFFLQTIGKLHNNTMVEYVDNKFKSILIRTLCRFIPFETLSFFGKRGWHDSISNTNVSKAS
jgi:hypothetical protein